MEQSALFYVFVFLAAACIVVPLASRFRLGSVLGYMIAGIVIGPSFLGIIHNNEHIVHFAEFGVVMMLFVIGLELEPSKLWQLRRTIIGLGGLQMGATTLAFTAIGIALGYDWHLSLAVAMALALSSTALVLQLLREKNLLHTTMGESSFVVLLFQDIAVIFILIAMPLLALNPDAASKSTSLIQHLPAWVQATAVAVAIGAVILIGRYVSHHLFALIAKTNLREVFTATSLALIVGITLLMQMVGISPALGAFIAGVVLANSEYKRTLETDIEPFKALLLGLFFISVGLGMDFNLLANEPLKILCAVLALMTVKMGILYLLGRLFKLPTVQDLGFAFALCQGGEFGFVLFQFAHNLSILDAKDSAFLTLVVAISIVLTPLLMVAYSHWVVPRFLSVLPERSYDAVAGGNKVIMAGYGRFGQIIGRFLLAQGVKVTILEKDPDQIDLLRKFGFQGYFGDASRLDLLKSAGAAEAEMLIVTVDDADNCLDIVRMARSEFPHLRIFARARNRRHAYELHKAGVDYFKRETFDSSLNMAQEIMVALGFRESDMQFKALQFMRHDEETLRKSFAFFEHEPDLVSFARLQTEELERILQSDVHDEEQQPSPQST